MSFWDRLLGRLRTASREALDDAPAEEPGAVLRDSGEYESPTELGDATAATGGVVEGVATADEREGGGTTGGRAI